MNNNFFIIAVVCVLLVFSACSPADNNYPGTEYMPDMGHSIAYESNHYDYYYYNTWGTEEEYHKMAQPREPVAGTIARGYAGVANTGYQSKKRKAVLASMKGIPINGSVPYHFEDTEEERLRATAELIDNPFPITDDGLARGKELYETFCGICHGNKGDGNGYLVAEDNPNAKYPAQPAILINDEFTSTSNGRLYHAIIYGKNVMGGYADKMSYEERWQVVHYIRALQAKDRKLVYAEEGNSLNSVDVPAFRLAQNEEEPYDSRINLHDPGYMPGWGNDGHHGGHGGDHGGSHGHDDGHGTGHDSHGSGHDDGHHGESGDGHHGAGHDSGHGHDDGQQDGHHDGDHQKDDHGHSEGHSSGETHH